MTSRYDVNAECISKVEQSGIWHAGWQKGAIDGAQADLSNPLATPPWIPPVPAHYTPPHVWCDDCEGSAGWYDCTTQYAEMWRAGYVVGWNAARQQAIVDAQAARREQERNEADNAEIQRRAWEQYWASRRAQAPVVFDPTRAPTVEAKSGLSGGQKAVIWFGIATLLAVGGYMIFKDDLTPEAT